MHRFYYPAPWHFEPERFELPEDIAHHVTHVLRMKTGECAFIFDGISQLQPFKIIYIQKKKVFAQIQASDRCFSDLQSTESTLTIQLAQCISTADKMDWTIEKAVELGVNSIVPLFSQRCQVKLEGERKEKKHKHWHNIISAACGQSQRIRLPTLHTAQKLSGWLKEQNTSITTQTIKVILHPDSEHHRGLKQIDKMIDSKGCAPLFSILVGPESGFSNEEVLEAIQYGFTPITIGPRILRTETAALAMIAALNARYGDFE